MNRSEIDTFIEGYYSQKVITHGPVPAGVDWNGEASQALRFEQLTKLMVQNEPFSLLDYGCGYGELYHFLEQRYSASLFKYQGVDLSAAMITHARMQYGEHAGFSTTINLKTTYDYVVASGLFNVKPINLSEEAWIDYISGTLQSLHVISQKGFSFNILTKYSDADKMRDYLFYADPLYFFDYCKKHFSRNIALLHDYDLYEFTILVRK